MQYDKILSDKILVKYGVPQGSKLGPILFIIYINDVVEKLKENGYKCKLFADDMMLYISSDDLEYIETNLNNGLKKLLEWLNYNSLKINIKKTMFVPIHELRKLNVRGKCIIKIGNDTITEVTETKYLGVLIDEHLLFGSHAWYVAKKIRKKIGFLNRVKKEISMYTRVTIIAPYFEYYSTVMFNLSNENMQVQKVQNRAMRAILNVNIRTPVRLMLDALGFMSVK